MHNIVTFSLPVPLYRYIKYRQQKLSIKKLYKPSVQYVCHIAIEGGEGRGGGGVSFMEGGEGGVFST